ncbi:MAG: hypothetical protein AAGG75_11590 [Bacteroidota bacterium]
MIRYFSTYTFLSDLQKLEKKPKNNYHQVRKDICTVYQDLDDIFEIIKQGTIIKAANDEDKKILLKSRFPNSAMREGKSGGFRAISIADIEKGDCYFLTVYPKKGKLGQPDLSEQAYVAILTEFIEQVEEGSLIELDIENDLQVADAE